MKITQKELYEAMKNAVGPENVSIKDFELLCYKSDRYWYYISPETTTHPSIVVRPKTTAQVLKIVRFANKYRIPVTPRGGGSGHHGGAVPVHGGILLSMTGMNKVKEINEEGFYATAQAGITVEKFEEELNKRGFTFGHDLGGARAATLGAQISCDSFGTRCAKYHHADFWLLGLEVVLPYGEVLRTRSTPKSSSFYNLKRMFIGAEGTLGVITEANVRIWPLPEARLIHVVAFDSFEEAFLAMQKIIKRGIVPAWLRVVDASKIREMYAEEEFEVGAVLYLVFEGVKKVANAQRDVTLKICRDAGGKELDPEIGQRWFRNRHIGRAKRFDAGRVSFLFEFGCFPDKALEVKSLFHEIYSKHGFLEHGFSYIGFPYGCTSSLQYFQDPDERKKFSKMDRELITKLLEIKGTTVTKSHGTGLRYSKYMEMEHGPVAIELMRRIKKVLDPNNIMNPGKMFP